MPNRLNREPSGEWKAIVLSYDFIFSLSEQKCSYCLTEQQASALMQIAEYLAWQTRWDDAAEGKDRDKLANFAADIQRELMMSCCGGNPEGITRYSEDGILEISQDGGVTWERAPDQGPRFNGPYLPQLPPILGQDMKCISAANVIEWLKNEQQETEDALLAGAGVSGILAAILSIVALVTAATGVGALLTPLLLGLSSALAATGQAAFAAAMTEEVYERLLCNIYCRCNDDGSVSEEQWQAIKEKISEDESGIAERFLYDNINAIGPAGLTNMMRSGSVTEASCSECPCFEACAEWSVDNFTGNASGVYLGEFSGYQRYESTIDPANNTQILTIMTPANDECCSLIDFRWVEGEEDVVATYRLNCGAERTGGNIINGWTLEGCVQYLSAQKFTGAGGTPFVVEFLFGDCE